MVNEYSKNPRTYFEQYESLDPETVHSAWLEHLPKTKSFVLDIGAGSGRDARWLASKGHEVVAVEPTNELLELAQRKDITKSVTWLSDSLPSLKHTYNLNLKFDLILLSAVWMHIAPTERERAFRKVVNLLRPSGKLVITLRRGPSTDERTFYPVYSDEIEKLAKAHVLEKVLDTTSKDQLGRDDVTWQTLVFKLPDDGTGGLPLLRHIIINDAKSSTYKLALLRVLLKIADGAQGAVISSDDKHVSIPFGLVALFWVKAFKPLILDAGYLQQPSPSRGLGFVREGFRGLKVLSTYDLRIGGTFSGDIAQHLYNAIKDARDTIHKMPAWYIKYPNREEQVFLCQKETTKRPMAFTLNADFLCSFGTFKVPLTIWNAMSQYACWIEPAILLEWSKMMKSFDSKAGKNFSLDQYFESLKWLDVDRDTNEVRLIVEQLVKSGKRVYCIWSGKHLKNHFDIDHCLPFAHWPNNDLWNLVPSHSKINNKKSDKLPSGSILEKSKERLLEWWDMAYNRTGYKERFWSEANLALPKIGGHSDLKNLESIYCGLKRQRRNLKVYQQLQEWNG